MAQTMPSTSQKSWLASLHKGNYVISDSDILDHGVHHLGACRPPYDNLRGAFHKITPRAAYPQEDSVVSC